MREDSLAYIKYIKNEECLICFKHPVDPDHLESIGMGGNRKKPTLKHYSCVPLCRLHHTERHSIGLTAFQSKYKIDIWKQAFILFRRYYIDKVWLGGAEEWQKDS